VAQRPIALRDFESAYVSLGSKPEVSRAFAVSPVMLNERTLKDKISSASRVRAINRAFRLALSLSRLIAPHALLRIARKRTNNLPIACELECFRRLLVAMIHVENCQTCVAHQHLEQLEFKLR
jgi:hypothetical protein